MPTRVGPQLVPDPTVPLIERLDRRGRNTVDAMFDKVFMQLGHFHNGELIVALMKNCLKEPIYARATPDVAWSTFIARLNDELFEDRLLTEVDSLMFWQTLFGRPEDAPAIPPWASGSNH